MENIYAVIDIGTRAGRMLILRRTVDYEYKPICKMSDLISVGLGIGNDGIMHLNNRYLDKLKIFLERAIDKINYYKVDHVLVIGTESFRKMINKDEILHNIYEELGIVISVLEPNTESMFGCYSVLDTISISENPISLIVDSGGGSIELSITERRLNTISRIDWISIPVGVMLPRIDGSLKFISQEVQDIISNTIDRFSIRNSDLYPLDIVGIKGSLVQIINSRRLAQSTRFDTEEIINTLDNHIQRDMNVEKSIQSIIHIRSMSILRSILLRFPSQNTYISSNGLLSGAIVKLFKESDQYYNNININRWNNNNIIAKYDSELKKWIL